MANQRLTSEMQQCISHCLVCHHFCLVTALERHASTGGNHSEPDQIELLINCAEICHMTARVIRSDSALYKAACHVCAKMCRRCAADCERLGGAEECAEACRRCAESCKRTAA